MQIFSNSTGAHGARGPQRPPQMITPDATRFTQNTRPSSATARRDSIDLSGAERAAGGTDGVNAGMTPQERLDALAQKYLDRLDALMQKEGLSREQIEGLQAAKDAFQQNIDRFSSTFLDGRGAGGSMGGAFGNIVGELRDAVQQALDPSGDGGDWIARSWQR